ncbi:hypothetical protein G5I_05273 [Acromyrmex echinatior]|uniref:Uncharacterized protein n=1 Tax=Acromyrmex echinatior TaxID=103372 RepID=F4WI04_ACREC|nr:hypothetical protein G5I_05273 [Acromyrmex echinatior]
MVRRWVHRKRMEGERAEVVERGLPSCDLETAVVAMSKINAIFWNPFKKQNTGFWHSFTRQSSDMAHRSTDYTAQNSSRTSTSCQKKHHPDHPAPPPLCIRSARFIATIYPRGILFFDQRRHIDDDAACCGSFRDWRSWREVKEITERTKP